MKPTDIERKLTAILVSDAVGYSRLMSDDPEATLATLTDFREVFSGKIKEYRGRVVNAPGDSILAEFTSVVEAVSCAVDIQRELAERNQELPDHCRMDFRIGLTLGDVLVKDEALYGDGVNIAARLESLAEPGGICISGKAYEEVGSRLPLEFKYLGEHSVKNIAKPVKTYQVLSKPGAAAHRVVRAKYAPSGQEWALDLPEKPSIAVLAFENMSGDPEQEYFSDGITEDIITELSRFKSLFVIARNSSFSYKGKSVTVQQVGQEMGVRYVLEGSVRKAGKRVRITAQLVDAQSGRHLWAERYDRDLEDVFSIQDEIAQMIVANVPKRLEAASLQRTKLKATGDMAAYDLVLRAKDHHHRQSPEDNAQALRLLDSAIDLDPDFAQAYAWKACTLGQAAARGYMEGSAELYQQAQMLAEKARKLDDDDSEAHRILCEIHLLQRRHDLAAAHHERAFSLNPNDLRIVAQRGQLLTWMGKADEGVAWIEGARRLDPYRPDGLADSLGQALFSARRYEEAIRAYKMIGAPKQVHHANMAACYAQTGQGEDAEAHAAQVRELAPDFSAAQFVNALPYKNETDREHHRDALHNAGLPE